MIINLILLFDIAKKKKLPKVLCYCVTWVKKTFIPPSVDIYSNLYRPFFYDCHLLSNTYNNYLLVAVYTLWLQSG